MDLEKLDITTLALIAGAAAAVRIRERLAAAGHAAARDSHGYIFQRLIDSQPTIGELADSLGITQQGASKQVVELERIGYVERVSEPSDSRIRRVRLTARGWEAIQIARDARTELDAELVDRVGKKAVDATRRGLAELLSLTGNADRVRNRNVPVPPAGSLIAPPDHLAE